VSLPFLGLIESRVVWDGNPLGFWKVQNDGSGEYQLKISAETAIVKGGNESLYVERMPGQYSTSYIYSDFNPSANWSGYDYLELWFYGNNTGGEMELWLRSGNNWDKRSFYKWSDVWVGWKRITFRFQNPTYTGSAGAVDLSNIDMIGIDGLTQNFIGSGTLLSTSSYLPYIRGENLNDRVFVYAAINAFGSAIFLFALWFAFIKKTIFRKVDNMNTNEPSSAEFHGRFLPAVKMLNLKHDDFMLDVGCSSGDLLQKLYREGFLNLVGIDIAKDRVHRSPRYLSEAVGSGLYIPFKDRVFTKVTMLEALEHVPRQDRLGVIGEIYRVLKPEGELVISVPTKSLFGYFDAGVWVGLHDSISLTTLTQLLQVAGFDLREIYQSGGFWHILEMYLYARRLSLLRFFKMIKAPSDIGKTPGWLLKKIDEEYQVPSNFGITLVIKAKKHGSLKLR
jgi:ubiquinone/menaquinone biosynthesis C-methylase UbiE